MKAEINISRLNYLLDLYKLTQQEFLSAISNGLKKTISKEEIFTEEISLNHLKRVDKLFNKGLAYYADFADPVKTESASIFFRKKDFSSDLNFAAKKIVREYEELSLSLSAYSKAGDFEIPRILPYASISENPRDVARKVRGIIRFSFKRRQKDFLESLINKLGEFNILVFEFVETHNQINKANIDGVFLSPNVIVLKRLDGFSYRREIFTLCHELGHYLLNIEEIEEIDFGGWTKNNLSGIERWCNDFAFHFLIGEKYTEFESLPISAPNNDYNHATIESISQDTNISKLALYTKLLIDKKISAQHYSDVKNELDLEYKAYLDEIKRKKQEDKDKGIEIKGGAPSPIKSELLLQLVTTAFYEGFMNEYQVCKTLKIQPEKLSRYISI